MTHTMVYDSYLTRDVKREKILIRRREKIKKDIKNHFMVKRKLKNLGKKIYSSVRTSNNLGRFFVVEFFAK